MAASRPAKYSSTGDIAAPYAPIACSTRRARHWPRARVVRRVARQAARAKRRRQPGAEMTWPYAWGSMDLALALLSSPLLGPAVWRPVAERLSQRGWTVIQPPQPAVAPRFPDDVLRCVLDALPDNQDLVLIPHSNAGLYVPALSVRRRVVGYVFVDAGLPAQYGHAPLAPPGFLEVLVQKADRDGLLPPWTDWWDQADLAPLFPDVDTREQVEREQRRLPLSYFRQSVPVPQHWDGLPGAYLAFGETYATDRGEAAKRGWPVITLLGGHLHMLVDADQVAAETATLLTAIGFAPHHR